VAISEQGLRFAAIESRLARLEGLFEQMNARVESIEARLTRLEAKVDVQFRWMIGLTMTTWVTLMVALIVMWTSLSTQIAALPHK
jgi:uncharacterized coiled-coil protein SlyX